ncbi:hypothetical protein LCGC14_2124530 [marine sediment metagenome]|uniref:Peptidase S1 domain-containing protein n=1 Tax=marine sediment metagenome TaxID=412755 RepID=A0A0F9GZI1_9ZZZZ
MHYSRTLSVLVPVMSILLAAGTDPAPGGTRRHDVADSEYTSLAAETAYDAVGMISTSSILASGVLVAENYVLTAAHVGEVGGSMTFALPSGGYVRAWEVIHPGWTGDLADGTDLALIRLDTLVLDELPAELYTEADEVGQTGVLVGFGRTGTGLDGATEPAGTKRAGENVWDLSGASFGDSDDLLLADFDNPSRSRDNWFGRPRAISLEYCIAPGDSGGGMFLDDGGVQKLAGVVSFIAWRDSEGDSDYGDAMGVVRISRHLDWLTTGLSAAYTMTWVGVSGGFNIAENWQTTFGGQTVNSVPGSLDTVRFDAIGSHVVTWPAADLANTRLSIVAGDVTLDLSGQTYALTGTGLSQPSLVVGEAGQSGQALTILNGTLSTQHAFLGPDVGSDVSMTVGAGATWNAGGSVYVGGTDGSSGGTARLIVDDAEVNIAGELVVWSGGVLELANGIVDVSYLTLAGGTLSGTGTVIGDVVVIAGVISPGGDFGEGETVTDSVYYWPVGVSATPEPASVTVLCMGAVVLLRRRRTGRGIRRGSVPASRCDPVGHPEEP